jgi:DNA polymerase III epsilon subunit family exonuclease
MSRLERRLLLSAIALFVVPAALGGLALLAAYRTGAFDGGAGSLVTALLVGVLVALAYAAMAAYGLGRSLLQTIETIRHGAELIATVNPDYRVSVHTGSELDDLARDINRLADDLREARDALTSPGLPVPAGLRDLVDLDLMAAEVAKGEGGQRSLSSLTFVVLDVETTGLRPDRGDRVVALAGIKVRGGAVRWEEVFDTLVNPDRPIPARSVAIHGITDERVKGAPRIETVLPDFAAFAEGAVLAGHELWFDLAFLEPEAKRLGLPPLAGGQGAVDTRIVSRLVHGSFSDHTLEAVTARLAIKVEGRHSALGDARATAEVLVRLIELLKQRGIVTLEGLLDAIRKVQRG